MENIIKDMKSIMANGGSLLRKSDDIQELYAILAQVGDLADMMEQVEGVTTVMSVDPIADIVPRRLYAIQALVRPYRRKEWKRQREPKNWSWLFKNAKDE